MSKAFYSPFRYPGGKGKLVNYIKSFIYQNNLNGGVYIEPFSGGASVALSLLIDGVMDRIVINDIDRSIYAAWYCILYDTERFINVIQTTQINIDVWEEQLAVQQNKENADIFDLGFSTFFLNRTNRSGIIKGGCIGGRDQTGNFLLDARFNKEDLIRRINLIARHRQNISLYNLDVADLIKRFRNVPQRNLVYYDPPYFVKGKGLYVNFYNPDDHKVLSDMIKSTNRFNWLVSYDNHQFIQDLYIESPRIVYELSYSAGETKSGSEVIFAKPNLVLPNVQNPSKMA